MRKELPLLSLMLIALAVVLAVPTGTFAAATISAGDYKAGDTVTIEGTVAPGQDLNIAIAEQKMFAPKDTEGVHEIKTFKKDATKKNFNLDTAIPPLYYMLTTTPDKFGQVTEKKIWWAFFFYSGR